MKDLPQKIDLRSCMPPVVDQGDLNSSAACAIATTIVASVERPQSVIYVYYNERPLEPTRGPVTGSETITVGYAPRPHPLPPELANSTNSGRIITPSELSKNHLQDQAGLDTKTE